MNIGFNDYDSERPRRVGKMTRTNAFSLTVGVTEIEMKS